MTHKPQHDPTSPSPADANPDTDRVEPRESGDELGAGTLYEAKRAVMVSKMETARQTNTSLYFAGIKVPAVFALIRLLYAERLLQLADAMRKLEIERGQ